MEARPACTGPLTPGAGSAGQTRQAPPVGAPDAATLPLEGGAAPVLPALTKSQARLLEALMRQPGLVQERQALLRVLYDGAGTSLQLRNVDAQVARLRRRLGVAGDRIETVRGVGYRWLREEAWQ